MRRGAVAAVLAVLASAAEAGPLELEAGASAVLLDTPHVDEEADALVAAAITATLQPDAQLPVAIRLHASIGRDGAGVRTLGIALRQQRDRRRGLVIDTGLAIASVVGARDRELMLEALRPRGLGLALDVRLGYLVGPVTIAAFALPTWVFASGGVAHETALRSAVEAGVSIGRAL